MLREFSKLTNQFYKLAYERSVIADVKDILKKLISKDIGSEEITEWLDKNNIFKSYVPNIRKIYSCISHIKLFFSNQKNDDGLLFRVKQDDFDLPAEPGCFFDLGEEAILYGTENIPNLYFYAGNITEEGDLSDLNESLGHNEFIVTYLHDLIQMHQGDGTPVKYFLSEIEDWCIINKDKINHIRKWFAKKPEVLGAGADGIAFDIGNDMVLKLFRKRDAYDSYKKSQDSLHNNDLQARTEIMIYDTGELSKFKIDEVFYVIMQRLAPVFEEYPSDNFGIHVRELIRIIIQYIRINPELPNIKKDYLKNKESKETKASIFNEIRYLYDFVSSNETAIFHIDEIFSLREMKDNWLQLFIEEIVMKYLTSRLDLHWGNLGLTPNGELRYFDPSFDSLDDFNISLKGVI